jgi:hypothetical protein
MNTATFIRKSPGWTGDARLPLDGHDHVIVSAVVVPLSGPFPADPETGEAINFLELKGSYRGGLNHAQALNDAGYRV